MFIPTRPALLQRAVLLTGLLVGCCQLAVAAVLDDVGYSALVAELQGNVPSAASIRVFQVEAGSNWFPDTAGSEFSGKTITSASLIPSPGPSSHATSVGQRFYGNSASIAQSLSLIAVHSQQSWVANQLGIYGIAPPSPVLQRVINHSWVSNGLLDGGGQFSVQDTSRLLRFSDWLSNVDEVVQVFAMNNGGTQVPVMSSAMNGISVGRSDAMHPWSAFALDSLYTGDRSAADLVVPEMATSYATPFVASAAAQLIAAGLTNPGWSDDATATRFGLPVRNAERSETIKAALMAGAARRTSNTAGADIADYRASSTYQTTNGLDTRYGAGQLDVYQSYLLLSAGESASQQDGGPAAVGFDGFDHDPAFGGLSGSNSVGSYGIGEAIQQVELAATLAWNIDIAGGSPFDETALRYGLELVLIDETDATEVASSLSSVDNTQSVWFELQPMHTYRLEVRVAASQLPFLWDYSLAWTTRPAPIQDADGDGLMDSVESFSSDQDKDGLPDYLDSDSDNNGMADAVEAISVYFPFDTDGDGVPDYADLDNDNDGVHDIFEIGTGTFAADLNNNGLADYLESTYFSPQFDLPLPPIAALALLLLCTAAVRCARPAH